MACLPVCVFVCPQHTLIIGADYYESEEQRQKVLAEGGVPLGVGAGTVIKNCIVDKNARIGRNVKIVNEGGVQVRRDCCRRVTEAGRSRGTVTDTCRVGWKGAFCLSRGGREQLYKVCFGG
jgi:hypothetical protein